MADMELYLGDCLEIMPKLADKSVDAIITDPPYFRVKDEPWDNQWDTRDGFLSWLGLVANEWQRILKPNGSLYVFASPQMAWYVEGVIRERFNVLNHIVWRKEVDRGKHAASDKDILRGYFPNTERIIFAEHGASDEIADEIAGFTAAEIALKKRIFGDYLASEFRRANITNKRIAGLFPSVTGGTTGCVSNWLLGLNVPTPEQYQRIRDYLNSLNCAEYLRQEYEDLRQEYEYLRQEYEYLRRPFNATPDAPYTDVWTFPTVGTYPGKHPCEKPLAMMEHIVNLSTRPGDLILDCFAGSGVTGMAAIRNNRRFVGIEMSEHWFNYTQRRIRDVSRAIDKLPKQLVGLAADAQGLPLFEVTQ